MTVKEMTASCKKTAPTIKSTKDWIKAKHTLHYCVVGCNAKNKAACKALTTLQSKVCNPAGKCAEFCRQNNGSKSEGGTKYSAAVWTALKCDEAEKDHEGQAEGQKTFRPK